MTDPGDVTLELRDIGLRIDGAQILSGIDWIVRSDERWAVLGRNGSGKTSLMRIASMAMHPSDGEVTVLGGRLGRVDVRRHRRRIGIASAAVADALRPGLTARDAVMTARHGALEPWWHDYADVDRAQAHELLDRFGVGHLATHTIGTLSSGERQRTLLARSLMTDPGILILDEPTAGLDLGGREELLDTLADLAFDASTPPTVLVTHHLEEIPRGFTHALLLREGQITAAGPIREVLTDAHLSTCFDIAVTVGHTAGRWTAQAG